MDLDDLLRRYFGTARILEVAPGAQAAGTEHLLMDFGLKRQRTRRFALRRLFAAAPGLDGSFEEATNQEVARTFTDMPAAAKRERS
ncbi:hypothetical protein [Novosphingopyxis sp.]|uniref:hypothetical protein n=1 Tax=Novosphingopyxis sp. TaxID=2709690 RepID=UPI003B590D91